MRPNIGSLFLASFVVVFAMSIFSGCDKESKDAVAKLKATAQHAKDLATDFSTTSAALTAKSDKPQEREMMKEWVSEYSKGLASSAKAFDDFYVAAQTKVLSSASVKLLESEKTTAKEDIESWSKASRLLNVSDEYRDLHLRRLEEHLRDVEELLPLLKKLVDKQQKKPEEKSTSSP